MKNQQEFHRLMIELIRLKMSPIPGDAMKSSIRNERLFQKLYEVMTVVDLGAFIGAGAQSMVCDSLQKMIDHFSDSEEYEKCAELHRMRKVIITRFEA